MKETVTKPNAHTPNALSRSTVAFLLFFCTKVLEGQERASLQTQGIADGLTATSERLVGLSDSLSHELVSAMGEIEKQVGRGSVARNNYTEKCRTL